MCPYLPMVVVESHHQLRLSFGFAGLHVGISIKAQSLKRDVAVGLSTTEATISTFLGRPTE